MSPATLVESYAVTVVPPGERKPGRRSVTVQVQFPRHRFIGVSSTVLRAYGGRAPRVVR